MLTIEPKAGGKVGGGKSPDELIDEMAEHLLSKLPEELTREEGNKDLFTCGKDGLMASLTTNLLQEMERYNKLLKTIKVSLNSTRNAIKGLEVMSEDLDSMYKSMMINRVPEMWSRIAYPSLKTLASWYENLI
jgi:dynein heavy chain